MIWRVYQVVLRLRSPLHIGCGKVGNLQRTRSYVTGRVLWGALTMRLTRDADQGCGPATDSRKYREFGNKIHQTLRFTYFYPASKLEDAYRVTWPWENKGGFRYRFLSSYQGTALSHPQQSAAEGMLHEVEFISPHTLDAGKAVFLKGYLFEKEDCALDWQSAFKRLQMGGERGYGWGDVELVNVSESADECLFGGQATFKGDGNLPIIHLLDGGHLLAHTRATDLPVIGAVEPLVGREWRSDNPRRRHVGQHVEFSDICFAPGSVALQALDFIVGQFGVWRGLDNGV